MILLRAAALLTETAIYKEHIASLNSSWKINDLSSSHSFLAIASSNANNNAKKVADDIAYGPAYDREDHGGLDAFVFDFQKNDNASFPLATTKRKQPVSFFKDRPAEKKAFQVCGVAIGDPKTAA